MNVYHDKLVAAAPGPDGINANCSTNLTADGGFSDLYFWSDGGTIQLFE